MRDRKLSVAPFAFLNFLECNLHKLVNEHATAHIVGHVEMEAEDEYLWNAAKNQPVTLSAEGDDGTACILFSGIVSSMRIQSDGALKRLTIDAVTYSSLLDKKKHLRSFQNAGQTYQEVATVIAKANQAKFLFTEGKRTPIGGLSVQYRETDWQFLKRLASQLNSLLVPDYKNQNICICFGIPKKAESYEADTSEYHVERDIGSLADRRENGVPSLTEQDSISHIVETREIYELCSPVTCARQSYLVYEIESRLEGGELIHRYTLRTQNGFRTKQSGNEHLIGASLVGQVLSVQRDQVTMKIKGDENPSCGAMCFPYSTVYSSPDGTGWYCMPEIGDFVRLQFPGADEEGAYTISSMHEGITPQRADPNIKFLKTKYGKQIVFRKNSISISNGKGMSVLLDDSAGVTVESDKDIRLSSSGSVTMDGSRVNLSGRSGVYVKQGGNSVNIAGGITENAGIVRIK